MFLKKKSLTKKAMCKKCTFQNQTNRLQCTALMLLSRWVIGSNPNGYPISSMGHTAAFAVIVAADGDPLKEITQMERIKFVMKNRKAMGK